MEQLSNQSEQRADVIAWNTIDLLLLIIGHWRSIMATVVAVVILTFCGLLFMDKWYESTAVVLLPERSTSPLDAIGGSFGGLGASLFGIGGQGPSRYMAILESRRLREEFIDTFGLVEELEVKNKDEALKALGSLLTQDANKKNGTIIITMRYKLDPEKTADMANFVVKKLDEINREIATEQARSTRLFIEQRYEQAKLDLRRSEDSLNVFQKQFGVLSIAEQMKAGIEAAAALQGEIVVRETELSVKKKSFGENHSDIARIESELVELRKTRNQMEMGGVDLSVFIPFKKTPDLAMDYYRYYRNVQVNSKVVEFLVPQYEQAKLQEAKDTPTLLVLDKAVPAARHYKPKKATIALFMGLLIFGLVVAFLAFIGHLRVLERTDAKKAARIKLLVFSFLPRFVTRRIV